MHPLPRSRSGFWRLVVGRALGTRPEEELLHLSLQKLAGLGLDRREPVLVDEHDLVLDPPGPAFARNLLEDALPHPPPPGPPPHPPSSPPLATPLPPAGP